MCYFDNAFTYPQEAVDVICHELSNNQFEKIDFLVGTGISGLILMSQISLQSKIPYGIMRKPSDSEKLYTNGGSHSDAIIETHTILRKVKRYAIIDDLIDSGATMRRIIDNMQKCARLAECEAILLYQQSREASYLDIQVCCLGQDVKSIRKIREEETCEYVNNN